MAIKKESEATSALALGEALKHRRESLGIPLRTLAGRVDFSPGFISQLEHGIVSPSIASLEKIAHALNLSLSELFELTASHGRKSSVGTQKVQRVMSEWSRAEIENLGSLPGAQLEAIRISIAPGGMSGKTPHTSRRERFVYVLSGAVTLTQDGADLILAEGDAVPIAPATRIRWHNHTDQTTRLLLVSGVGR